MLSAYRRFCAAHSAAGQLILPESLKLMPLYLSCATKLCAFTVNKALGRAVAGKSPFVDVLVRADRRAAALVNLMCLPSHRVVPTLYPRFFRVDILNDDAGVPPASTPFFGENEGGKSILSTDALFCLPLPSHTFPSFAQIAANGVYILDSQEATLVLVAPETSDSTVFDLFGVKNAIALAATGGGGGTWVYLRVLLTLLIVFVILS